MNKKIQIMIFRRFQIAAIGLSCLCCNIHGQTFGDAFEDKTLRLDYTFCGNNRHHDFEDLAALIYIKSFISPDKYFSKIRHVVIDEAQDLGEFNFFSLKKTLPLATFSIFGDLAQSIYDYRGVDNWDEVNKVMFNNNGNIINFNKSYRTTAEIMSVADDIAESIGLTRSELVIRHGRKVDFTFIDSDKKIPEYIAQKICNYKEKGYKNIFKYGVAFKNKVCYAVVEKE